MSKHSPGPWKIVTNAAGYPCGIEAPKDRGIPGAVGCVVRQNGLGLPSSEAGQANARLIAAAPDLLAACKDIVRRIEDWEAAVRAILTVQPEHGMDLSKARAAIAKAGAA